MNKIHSEKKEMPIKLSSSIISAKSEEYKSPKIGKRNYILKTELSSMNVHTPSVNPNQNPLFNYYNFSSSEVDSNTILNIEELHSNENKEEYVYSSQSNNQTDDSSGKIIYKDESDGSLSYNRSMPSPILNDNTQITFSFQIQNSYEDNDMNYKIPKKNTNIQLKKL